MIYSIATSVLTSWEAVATVQLLQTLPAPATVEAETIYYDLFTLGDINVLRPGAGRQIQTLVYSEAYREVEMNQKDSYVEILARSNGFMSPGKPRWADYIQAKRNRKIVVCPFAIRTDMQLNDRVWSAVVRHLRTYADVQLMGDYGERLDSAMFTEAERVCDRSAKGKLEILASAELIVGVPNAWTWAATAWDKTMVLLYPETVPYRRWFPYEDDQFGRILYHPMQVQVPILLTALRKLVARL